MTVWSIDHIGIIAGYGVCPNSMVHFVLKVLWLVEDGRGLEDQRSKRNLHSGFEAPDIMVCRTLPGRASRP